MLAYTILLAILSWSVFSLEDNYTKGLLTLLNVILLNVPLVSVIFSTIYIYNSAEFIELLLSQPVKRSRIWLSIFIGLSLSLVLAFLAGTGIPVLLFAPTFSGFILMVTGCFISVIFVSLAMLSSILTRDKAKGIGLAIILWLFFALLFDGLVLFLVFQFGDYPIEKPMIAISMFNPIDLARILILLQLDISALMGYTGAVFKEFFGTRIGFIVSFVMLGLWILIPFLISLKKFNKKDL